jgi:hypothetical protein
MGNMLICYIIAVACAMTAALLDYSWPFILAAFFIGGWAVAVAFGLRVLWIVFDSKR